VKREAQLDSSEVLTVQQVAEYLNCSYITVWRLLRSGQIPAFRVGSEWRLRRTDFDRWLEGQRVVPTVTAASSKPERRGRPKK
jgi:excisionase family DNA binding protein